jgi:hypothetical protein
MTSPLDFPFRGRSEAVSAPVRRRFIFPGGGLGVHLRLPVSPAGDVGQEQGSGTRADSFLPLLPVSAPPGPALLALV